MSSFNDQHLSILLCTTLDNLGFKKENIILKSKTEEEKTEITYSSEFKKHGISLRLISAGSCGEGTQLAHSDKDIMLVFENIICLNKGGISEQFITLQAVDTGTAPGYTRVVLVHAPRSESITLLFLASKSLTYDRNLSYISSTMFRKNFFFINSYLCKITLSENCQNDEKMNGPAITNKIITRKENLKVDNDAIYSVYFYGGEYLAHWANRRRYYLWPSKETVNQVAQMEGYIVPVGDKQSENQDLEWRICYTTAEKKLVSSLNDVQLKLYVLLKLLSKHVLKPVCKALTSYVVKNVVFWVSETAPAEEFSPNHLVHLVLKSLRFIKYCIENNHLPNYMIPERNLLRGAVYGSEKHTIVNFLSECLAEKWHVLVRIPKLYHCISIMAMNPDLMLTYGQWRDEVEKIHMLVKMQCSRIYLSIKSPFSPSIFDKMPTCNNITEEEKKLHFLVVPDCMSMICAGKSNEDITNLYLKRLTLLNIL